MPNNKKIKLGVIGAGLISQLCHISNYSKNKHCEILALADYRNKLREKVGKKFNIKYLYSNHKELLKNSEIDAVIIVTGRENIGPVAYDCLKKKKHIFTEKPSAHTFFQAKKLVGLANKKKVKYVVGYMKRYDEGIKKAKKIFQYILKKKKFGKINFVRVHNFMGDSYCDPKNYIKSNENIPKDIPAWPKAPNWIKKKNIKHYAGYINTYCHDINLLRYFFDNEIKIKFTDLSKMNGRIAVFKIKDFLCSFETGRSEYHIWDEEIEIYFDKGKIKLKLPVPLLKNRHCELSIYDAKKKIEKKLKIKNNVWSFKKQADEFISLLRFNKKNLNPGKDALQDLKLLEKIWKY